MLPSTYGDPARLELGQIYMRPRKKVSSAGIELIESFEGLRRKAARLPDGRWTIGYGHTQSAREGLSVTAEEARLLLIWDLRPVEAIVDALVVTPVNQNQFDAIVAFAFNVGLDAFKDSDVLKLINEGRFTQAACALDLWRKADIDGDPLVLDALIRRRAAEKDLFLAPADGETPAAAPTALVHPEPEAASEPAVPETRPVELDAPLEGPVAEVHPIGEIEREPQPRPASQPAAVVPAAAAVAVAVALAHEVLPEVHAEPAVEAAPEPAAETQAASHSETALDAHAETAGEMRTQDAPLALTVAAAAAAVAAHAFASAEVAHAEAPEAAAEPVAAPANEDHAPSKPVEAEAAEPAAVEAEPAPAEPAAEAPAELVVPLLTPPAAAVFAGEPAAPAPAAEPDEVLSPFPSSWGVEAGQVSAMAVAVAWPVAGAAPEPTPAPVAEVLPEPEAVSAPIEAAAPVEPEAAPAPVAAEIAPDPMPAPVTASAEPVSMPDRAAPVEAALESVFASYGPMAFAVMPRKPRPSEPSSAPAPAAEEAGETADPEPRPAPPAETAAVAPVAPAPVPSAPAAAPQARPFAPVRSAAASFGPMFVPETRNLSEIAPAPAVLAAAPEPQPLVLTSPPADWDDARYGATPTITALSPELDELETPLFDEGWDAPSALSSRVVRHEMTEFTPPRGIRFGETGPWILLGLVGFAANGGALFGLLQGRAATVAGSHDGHTLVLALGLIGVACIGVSGYFLFKRLGGAED